MIHYSAKTGGFYDDIISPPPEDAIEIDRADHAALLAAQAAGQVIVADDSTGRPVAVDRTKTLPIAQAREEALATLSAACTLAIEAGFSAGGRTITLSIVDQANLDSAYQMSLMIVERAITWTPNAVRAVNDVLLVGDDYYLCTTAGVSGETEPVWSTEYQSEIRDGTAGWSRAGYLVGTSTGTVWVSAGEAIALWRASKNHITACRSVYRSTKRTISLATTKDDIAVAVAAVIWPITL